MRLGDGMSHMGEQEEPAVTPAAELLLADRPPAAARRVGIVRDESPGIDLRRELLGLLRARYDPADGAHGVSCRS